MGIFTLLDLDEEGNEREINYELNDDVIEYIEQCDVDHAVMFTKLMYALTEVQELNTLLEGYRILVGDRVIEN
tara:strand:- start:1359 stop:1577 length:219 start_codon:yes stop_codon:yes gene_type:complete